MENNRTKGVKRNKTVGVKEIARRAGVSIATVDRVLHNRPGVAPSTKRRIKRIIKEVNYKPNLIASRLASSKIFHLAVLIPEISEKTDFWQAPLDGINRAEGEIKGFGVSVDKYLFQLGDKETFIRQSAEILESGVDGVLMAPSFVEEAKVFVNKCEQKNIPVVLIDSDIPGGRKWTYIGPNLFRSGTASAQLVDLTKKKERILILNIAQEVDYHNYLKEIEQGFRSYFSDTALNVEIKSLKVKHTDYSSVSATLDELYKGDFSPQTIFVTNSRVGAVAKYFKKKKTDRPFLIGFDFVTKNVEYLKEGFIDILICHKSEEQGYKGIMTLYQRLLLHEETEINQFMPIDIITKENYEFYHN